MQWYKYIISVVSPPKYNLYFVLNLMVVSQIVHHIYFSYIIYFVVSTYKRKNWWEEIVWLKLLTLFIRVISVERAPLTWLVAISPVYMGATVYTTPYPRPENIRATYSSGTDFATMTSTQPMIKGTAPRSSVVFLPNRSAKYAEGIGVSAEHRIIIETIHDPSSGDVGIELSADWR